MQIIRQQRDWIPKSVESRADTLSVRLWGLLRAFPSLFTLQRSIHCNKTGMVAVNALLKCRVALDATCRLTLSILYFESDHAFVTSFLPFRSTFGIFNLFDKEFKSYDHRGIRTPNLLIRSQTPYPLGYAACWGFSHLFFCNEWIRWGVKWHMVLAIVSLCRFCVLLEIDVFQALIYFV